MYELTMFRNIIIEPLLNFKVNITGIDIYYILLQRLIVHSTNKPQPQGIYFEYL